MTRISRMDALRRNDPAATAAPSLDARAEADLQRIVDLPAAASPSEVYVPVRRSRRRLAVAVAAGSALVAGFAVAVPLVGGGETTSPAHAVTKADDGTITVTLYREEDAEGLKRRLAEVGVRAEVVFLEDNMRCERTPKGVPFYHVSTEIRSVEGPPRGVSFTFRAPSFEGATLTFEQSKTISRPRRPVGQPSSAGIPGSERELPKTENRMALLKTGTFGPCVQTPMR